MGEHVSYADIAETISKVTGKPVKYVPLDRDTFASMPFPGVADLANMFAYYDRCSTFADLRPMSSTIVRGKSFEEWAKENAEVLKSEVAAADQ